MSWVGKIYFTTLVCLLDLGNKHKGEHLRIIQQLFDAFSQFHSLPMYISFTYLCLLMLVLQEMNNYSITIKVLVGFSESVKLTLW